MKPFTVLGNGFAGDPFIPGQAVNCESCGADGCDSDGDRCFCEKVICSHCMDNEQLCHIKGGGHLLLKDIFIDALGARNAKFPSVGNLSVYKAGHVLSVGLALLKLVDRTAAFQREKFPHQPVKAKCKHLAREANELHDAPGDVVENADCLNLTLGINAANGRTIEDLLRAAHAKMDVVEKRTWGEADAEGVHHHIEEAR